MDGSDMGESSLLSSSNYFDRLRYKAREIDEGINKLSQTWKTPHLLIGGYAERTDEMNAYLEELWNSSQSTGDAVEKMQPELELSLKQTDQLLEESREVYQEFKDKCDNIDVVLMEYDYHAYGYQENNDSAQESHDRDDSKSHTNDSATGIDEIPDVEVEFTPYLTWKSKARSKGSDASDHQYLPTRGIATPVIKSLASVLRLGTPNAKKIFVDDDTTVQETNRSKGSTKVLRK